MKKQDFLSLLYRLASPIALMALGGLLIWNPDSAASIVGKLLGWGLSLAGAGLLLAAIFGSRKMGRILWGVVLLSAGSFFLSNPLWLMASLGKLLGLVITVRGLRDLFLAWQQRHGLILAAITTGLGTLLILLPLTTSRLVFTLCGIALVAVGGAIAVDKLNAHRYLPEGERKQDIIDAL